jgi:hypothetical protein
MIVESKVQQKIANCNTQKGDFKRTIYYARYGFLPSLFMASILEVTCSFS